ncbi:hypothetical protein [Pseudomonas sp. Irchel s3h17]|uniref:hypothetical protein n=1 Tax=Pseudomonas sp. Irchel s3h17 TaxID=2009182 RepID=UPI000BA337B1|nr:hypothetical protein [Pseudomonas sp. Irchel s3h17]
MNLSTIQGILAEQHAADCNLYLLLDPLAGCASTDPLHIDALRHALGERAVTRLPRPDLAHSPQDCPALVTLASPGESPCTQRLRQLALRSQIDLVQPKRYVCSLLSSPEPAEIISAHILSLGHLPTEQGQPFIPVYEPLRLELLAACVNHLKQGRWWPIRHWVFPTSSGTCSVLIGDPKHCFPPDPEAASVQQDVILVSALLSSWRQSLQQPLTFAPTRWTGPTSLPASAAVQAYAHICLARELGLHDHDDIRKLALHSLMLHPRVHEHARVRALIGQAVREQTQLGALLAPYTDRSWQRVVSDLTYSGAAR